MCGQRRIKSLCPIEHVASTFFCLGLHRPIKFFAYNNRKPATCLFTNNLTINLKCEKKLKDKKKTRTFA